MQVLNLMIMVNESWRHLFMLHMVLMVFGITLS